MEQTKCIVHLRGNKELDVTGQTYEDVLGLWVYELKHWTPDGNRVPMNLKCATGKVAVNPMLITHVEEVV